MTEYEGLLAVQELDLEILRLEETAAKLEGKTKLKQTQLAKKKLQAELNKILGQRKDAEAELEELLGKKSFYVEKSEEIQAKAAAGEAGYRQLKDVEYQLSHLAKKIERADFDLKEKEPELEKLKRAEANAQTLMERLEKTEAELVEAYEKKEAEVAAALKRHGTKREELLLALSPEVQNLRAAKLKQFKGLYVERLRGNVPSVCRVKLQPAQFSDLKRAGSICECPYCKRLLVTEDLYSDEK